MRIIVISSLQIILFFSLIPNFYQHAFYITTNQYPIIKDQSSIIYGFGINKEKQELSPVSPGCGHPGK
jgi:hypothetical protein